MDVLESRLVEEADSSLRRRPGSPDSLGRRDKRKVPCGAGVNLHPSRLCRPEHPSQLVGGPVSILMGTCAFRASAWQLEEGTSG